MEEFDEEEVRSAFSAWRRSEGKSEDVIEQLLKEHYGGAASSIHWGEMIKIQTWFSSSFQTWNEKYDLGIKDLMMGKYYAKIGKYYAKPSEWVGKDRKKYGKHSTEDVLKHILEMNEVLVFESYFRHLTPPIKTMLVSKDLAISGRYMEAFILLRSAFEGAIKAGIKAWKTHDDGDLDTEKKGEVNIETIGLKKLLDLDKPEYGLSRLSKEADEIGLCNPISDLYNEYELYIFNKFVHHNEEAGDEIGWSQLVSMRNFDEKVWADFANQHANMIELLLIVTHNYARRQEWFDVREMDLDAISISEHFPLYAEALIPDGLVENCIECKKPLIKKRRVVEFRGRCISCDPNK